MGYGLLPPIPLALNPTLYRSRSASDIFLGLASPPPRTKSVESPPLAHCVGYLRTSFYAKDQASSTLDGLLKDYPTPCFKAYLGRKSGAQRKFCAPGVIFQFNLLRGLILDCCQALPDIPNLFLELEIFIFKAPDLLILFLEDGVESLDGCQGHTAGIDHVD